MDDLILEYAKDRIPSVNENKEDLILSYARHLALERFKFDKSESFTELVDMLKTAGELVIKYVPHLYRGGYVIPGFGWSTERIPYNKAIMTSVCKGYGNPLLVGNWKDFHDICIKYNCS